MSPAKLKRFVRTDGAVSYVPLTRGFEAIIDTDDVPIVENRHWTAASSAEKPYAYYRGPRPKQAVVYMHRVLLSAPADMCVDHINGNVLDNRRANLRLASRSQNQWNSRIAANNKSGFRGVFWRADRNCWRAEISAHGVTRSLGSFSRIEDACEAYASASKELHGEYRREA